MKPSAVSMLCCGFFALLVAHTVCIAGPTIQWNPDGGGSYFQGDFPGPANDPNEQWLYVSGASPQGAGYLLFDLSSLAQDVLAVSLELDATTVSAGSPFSVSLYDIVTPLEYLTAEHAGFYEEPGPDSGEIWNDLHGGAVYGSATLSASDQGSHVTFTFNQDGIDAVNAAQGGWWAVALSPDDPFAGNSLISGWTDIAGDNYLNMQTVPEPSTMALFALGGITAALAARRHPRRSAPSHHRETISA